MYTSQSLGVHVMNHSSMFNQLANIVYNWSSINNRFTNSLSTWQYLAQDFNVVFFYPTGQLTKIQSRVWVLKGTSRHNLHA